jgi:nitroreductase
MRNPAHPDHEIEPIFAQRWSPYLFEPRGVEDEQLRQCLEAARWAASSYNEQPWAFIVARREDAEAFNTMLDCLVEANQAWAKNVGALIITVIYKTFTKNGKPNRVAEHDLGLAAANLVLQATALGLQAHQMAGVNLSKARQTYQIPETHEPFTAIALGHPGNPARAGGDEAELAERDRGPRTRKPLQQIIYADRFGQAAPLVQ